jgi:hypothetical protein
MNWTDAKREYNAAWTDGKGTRTERFIRAYRAIVLLRLAGCEGYWVGCERRLQAELVGLDAELATF